MSDVTEDRAIVAKERKAPRAMPMQRTYRGIAGWAGNPPLYDPRFPDIVFVRDE